MSTACLANAAVCEGRVVGVALDPPTGDVLVDHISLTKVNEVAVSGQAMLWPRLCSVINSLNGIPPEGCKSLYATLLAAQATSRTVTLWIRNTESCTAYSPWNVLTGFYFMRIN